VRADVVVSLWRSAGLAPRDEAPLLVVHDGPEYSRRAGVTRVLEQWVEDGRVPPLRAALLAPVRDRMDTYSALPAYARALARQVLPQLRELAPARPGQVIGVGASLGAFALLHAHERHPGTFGALYLQSGSFFQRAFDAHAAKAAHFRRIVGFVDAVLRGRDPHPTTVTMTCGRDEENLRNNRALAAALREQGYRVRFHTHPGGHEWPAWRSTFDPHLLRLVRAVARA
jgi:enterochelin esterase family protein